MTSAAVTDGSPVATLLRRRRLAGAAAVAVLAAACLAAAVLSIGTGAIAIPPGRVVAILGARLAGGDLSGFGSDAAVVMAIRLPRTLTALLVGGTLAACGALMQGLFRNPLADPGLVGVSAGASMAAVATIVLGDRLFGPGALPFAALPVAAFAGGLAVTLVLFLVASRDGRAAVATLLLAGIAVGALGAAVTGLLSFMSDDRQLRDLTFWSLGSLAGSTWGKLAVIGPVLALVLVAVPRLAAALDALVLGEAEAYHLGIPVERAKTAIVVLVAIGVGASVATAGVIGFVGIVVPHLVRLVAGAGHRLLLAGSILLGAVLVCGADIVARIVVAPAELPIGIVTAIVGAPCFLWLILGRARSAAA